MEQNDNNFKKSIKEKSKQVKLAILTSVAGDCILAVIAFFLINSSYAFSVSRYVAIDFLAILLMVIWPMVTCVFFVLKEKYRINKYSLTWIFCITLSFFIGIVFFAGLFTHGEAIRGNLHPDEMDAFMDFYNSIQFGMEPYKYKTIYPPFISVLYGLIGQFVPINEITEHAYEIRESQMGSVIYVIYSVFLYGFLAWLVCSFKRGSLIEKVCFTTTLFFTRPFLYAFERGNSIVLTLLFIMLFLKWYTSSNIRFRICAYIALGLATGIKIAPFILILLLLRRREYLNTVIATAITAVLFFVPFIFTDGDIWILANNLSYTSSLFQGFVYSPDGTVRMMGFGGHVNFVNLINFLGRSFNFNAYFIGKYLNYLLLILGSGIVFVKKDLEEWKAVTILMGLMILCPGFSAIYTLIYMIPPLILYLNHYEENTKSADWYLFLFIVMMIPFLKTKNLFTEDVYSISITTLCEIISVNLLVIIVILFACYTFIEKLPHRTMAVIAFITLCLVGYPLYYKFQPTAVDAFYPMNYKGCKAQQGVTMHKGFYKYIKDNAAFTLNREKVLKSGLTVTLLNEFDLANEYEIIAGNTLLKQGMIKKQGKELVYIDSKTLESNYNGINDKLIVKIKNKGQQPLTLQYVGVTKPLDKLSTATYIDNSSEGFIRESGSLQMSEYSRFLLSGESLKRGILFRYAVPVELLNANGGKDIVFDLYINGNKIKSIPIKFAGYHYAIIDSMPGVSHNVINEIEFKLNASYLNSQFDPDADDRRRGIFIDYFGNVDQTFFVAKQAITMVSSEKKKHIELMIPNAQDSFSLTSLDKREWFYPANIIANKDICVIYAKNKNLNRSLKLQIEINGRKEIREVENSKFNEIAAVVIPSSAIDSARQISVMNLKLLNSDDNDGIFIKYAGPSVLQRDVKAEQFTPIKTDAKHKEGQQVYLSRTSGLYYDSEVKALQMLKKADILLDNRYMEDKNLEIDFSIAEGLSEYFEDKDKNMDVFLDNKYIMSVPLKSGKQKIVMNKTLWSHTKLISTLTIKSTLYDLSKRVHLPRGLRNRGVEISYIGVER